MWVGIGCEVAHDVTKNDRTRIRYLAIVIFSPKLKHPTSNEVGLLCFDVSALVPTTTRLRSVKIGYFKCLHSTSGDMKPAPT